MANPQPKSHMHVESSTSSSPKYKGVRLRKWGKWVSEIRLPNCRERIWLGSYDSPEKAARAFDAAQYCLRGNKAKFNFPDNPPDIVGGRSLSPLEIQAVASKFANESTNNSASDNNNVGTTTGQYALSSSDGGGAAIQVECNETMDWSSFLSMLDINEGMSDYGFYPGVGDQFYPSPVYDEADDNVNGDGDGFSQQSSFLWNF
ncbi:ERF017 protein [Hibiscus syriacus]|uniref:ERF017 protein n=1 Tax=Hibiscus syriacus TaxID=106335 RepID=A0A6A2Z6H0_HIBSY|nr:ethylene-responsive transcription factor ERF017-like [Hibiscus syriacus]KAE8687591.1 ERF017 protein [Hibiscus syriacus]